jgi:hypothetical protein
MENIRKILYLVPNAKCRNYEGEIVEWLDSRSQPSQAEIAAVVEQDVVDSEEDIVKEKEFDKSVYAMGETFRFFINDVIRNRKQTITEIEIKEQFKLHL